MEDLLPDNSSFFGFICSSTACRNEPAQIEEEVEESNANSGETQNISRADDVSTTTAPEFDFKLMQFLHRAEASEIEKQILVANRISILHCLQLIHTDDIQSLKIAKRGEATKL